MIEQNAVFEIQDKKFFYEGNQIYNAETGEVVATGNNDFHEVVYDTSWYSDYLEYYLFFSRKQESYDYYGNCDIEAYIIRKDENFGVIIEQVEPYKFQLGNSYCQGPFSFNGNSFTDEWAHSYQETYPGKNKNLKKYSTEFKQKVEPPKETTPPKDNTDTGSGTQEPPKDGTQDQTIKNEIKTENQFFKDIELKNFDFKYQEITKNGQLYIVQDSTEYQNYIANKVNEFTLFTYIAVFFFITFFTFNFIKNILGK